MPLQIALFPAGPPEPTGLIGASRQRLAAASGRIPPGVLLLLSILCVQLSSALATTLFSDLGPAGTTLTSTILGAAVLTLSSPPRIDGRVRRYWRLILLAGFIDALMALPFFMALQYIPLGLAATIGFLGPLGLAVATSRRFVHFVWIGLAAIGVGLLMPAIGTDISPIGIGLAGLSALGWAAFVLVTKKIGRIFDGRDGLSFGLWVSTLLMLPFALHEGSVFHAGIADLAGSLGVALLGAVLPLALEFHALQRMSARTYGTLMTLEPAAGALVGAIFLDQGIGPRVAAAIACVTIAALGVTLLDRRGEN
jgi:inner membrane transporter RhtA